MQQPEPATYTVAEAARLLGVGESTLYRALSHGDVPHIRIGCRRVISRRWLERQLGDEELSRAS